MTSFDDEFAASAFPELIDEFGQETTYRKSSGTTRTIDAILITNELALQGFADDAPASRAIVRVANSATRGILASEIICGRDSIDIPVNGLAAAALTIQKIISENGAVTSVLCY